MPQSYTIRGCQRGTWRSVSISVNGGPPPRPRNPGPRGRTFARRSSAASRCASSVAPSPARKPRSLPAWRDERNTRNFVLALRPRGYNSGMRRFRVSLAQINPTVGDVEGNTRRIVDGIAQARALGADLVAFPELAITGYPPEDLLFKSAFIEANLAALAEVTKAARGLTAVVGFVDKRQDLFNAAAVIHDGALAGVYHKQYLPNYGVFDENRTLQAVRVASVFSFCRTCAVGNVCEDLWNPTGPTTPQALAGAELIVTINGSPYHAGKARFRERMVATRAADDVVWLAFVNMVGGQDELVFDGASVIVDPHGETVARGRQFVEEMVTADLDLDAVFRARLQDSRRRKETLDVAGAPRISLPPLPARSAPPPPVPAQMAEPLPRVDEVFQALVRGTLLMALSNKFGWLVLTTGNKSEIAVGYSTLYGDMAGGFAVIKDVPKTLVYELSRHVNARAGKPVIPESIIERAPSAELRHEQKDQDTLPPYDVLDAILEAYVEESRGVADLIAQGFDPATVRKVVRMIDAAEYKRRQGPIGVKITPRAFGRDWRLPIVNRFREK